MACNMVGGAPNEHIDQITINENYFFNKKLRGPQKGPIFYCYHPRVSRFSLRGFEGGTPRQTPKRSYRVGWLMRHYVIRLTTCQG